LPENKKERERLWGISADSKHMRKIIYDGFIMSEKMNLYKKIYDLADANMEKNGGRIACAYPSFASRIGAAPDIVDISEFDGMANDEIFVAAYLRCLDRLPEKDAWSLYDRLTEVCRHTENSFQVELLSVISESEEFRGNYKKITGLYDIQDKEEKSQLQEEVVLQKIYRVRMICYGKIIIPVWKIFPAPVKNLIRKAARREKNENMY